MKIHLVDGTYELFRCFFGAPPRTASDGAEVGALRGLLATLVHLVSDDDVTHVAVAFDHVIESFRNDRFDGYKTGFGIDPRLLSQFHPAEDLCRALGLIVWPMVEFEADDALATAAAAIQGHPDVDQVVICTPDKDLAQCVVGDHVVAWDRRRDVVLDEDGVVDKFGVHPASIPDWLALVGDTADGIPGLPRWGKKSASTVLYRYGTLDEIPDDAAGWDIKVRGAASLAEVLAANRPAARLYRELATLRLDVPLDETTPTALRWPGANPDTLPPLAQWMGTQATLDRIHTWTS